MQTGKHLIRLIFKFLGSLSNYHGLSRGKFNTKELEDLTCITNANGGLYLLRTYIDPKCVYEKGRKVSGY